MKTFFKLSCVLALLAGFTATARAVTGSWDSYDRQTAHVGEGINMNGWCMDTAHPGDGTLVANIYVDDNLVSQVYMTDYRGDLGGNWGWHYTISTSALSVGTHSISVWIGNNTYGGWLNFTQSYVQGTGSFTLSAAQPSGSISGPSYNITGSSGTYVLSGTNYTWCGWNVVKDGYMVASDQAINNPNFALGYNYGAGTYQISAGMSGPGGLVGTNAITTVTAAPRWVFDYLQSASPTTFAVASGGTITASGWAFDYQNGAPISVKFYVDGVERTGTVTTGQSRPDVQTFSYSNGYSPGNDVTASGWSVAFNSTGLGLGSHTLNTVVANSFAGNHADYSVTSYVYSFTVANPPAVTSAVTASGNVGSAFSYAITGSNSPTSYSASGLPGGLSINTSTGAITGTPTATGTTNVTIGATNAVGTGIATLVLTVHLPAPAITSALTATATAYSSFSYTITGSYSPTGFNATGLPSGLTVNTSSGVISGTPTATATSNITLSASNASGTGTATLVLTVNHEVTPPSVPTGLSSSSVTATGFTLHWTASTDNVGVTGYEVFKNGVSYGTTASTSMTVTGLSPSTLYSMKVRARDAVPNWSAQSTALSVTTTADTTPPSAPTGLVASAITPTTFTVSWSASTDNVGVTAYQVFKSGVSAGTTATHALNLIALTAHTTYAMTVKARDAAGNWSVASSTLNVTTLSDPNADDDHDGLTNGQEALLGTNPNVAATAGTAAQLNLKTNTPR